MLQSYEVRNKLTSLLLSTIGRKHDGENQVMRAGPTDNFFHDDTGEEKPACRQAGNKRPTFAKASVGETNEIQ
jgi:hypothetical protein